ncbi:MAG: hypothetical protein KDA24_29180, partial [Deltaproteobacteria bacterium]|nr:hypothetical protein [Deltaproteobacteria bacterium]
AAAGAAVQFEILSRRNQKDLYDQMNDAVDAGPAYVRFRSQSRSKGDDFYFGLAEIRWDGGEPDINEHVFTLILDSEKLVTKARSGAKLPFPEAESEHDVQVWYDGDRMAIRVDGEALGPFEARPRSSASQWFLSLNDDARAWNLEFWPWSGSLANGEIPSGMGGRSFESTKLEFEDFALPSTVTEKTRLGELPMTFGAPEVRVSFTARCLEKSTVIVRIDDGREVILGREVAVRGAAKMPKARLGLACRGQNEPVTLVFAGDGAVSGTVGEAAIPLTYPGRRGATDGELRVKGDNITLSDIVYSVGSRARGRRVFRAEKAQ